MSPPPSSPFTWMFCECSWCSECVCLETCLAEKSFTLSQKRRSGWGEGIETAPFSLFQVSEPLNSTWIFYFWIENNRLCCFKSRQRERMWGWGSIQCRLREVMQSTRLIFSSVMFSQLFVEQLEDLKVNKQLPVTSSCLCRVKVLSKRSLFQE